MGWLESCDEVELPCMSTDVVKHEAWYVVFHWRINVSRSVTRERHVHPPTLIASGSWVSHLTPRKFSAHGFKPIRPLPHCAVCPFQNPSLTTLLRH